VDRPSAASAIVAAGRRLGTRGLISAGEGNLSIRLDAERLLVTPTGRRKDELDADDLIVVRLGHDERGARSPSGLAPTSDLAIHLAVHRARPDLGAMVHAHLPASMALTLAGEAPDPTVLPETAYHLPVLPLLPYGEMGSDELAARVAATFGGDPAAAPRAVVLERHGAIAIGPDVDTAVDRLELVEVLCRSVRDALLVQAARASLTSAGIVMPPAAPTPPPQDDALREER
jgi:L-fuculose-phosphate aldolase